MKTAPDAPNLDRVHVLDDHGSRQYVYPADVEGKFSRWKPRVYAVLIAIYAILPWIKIGGHPAILLDIPARRFYILGKVFNSQDFYLSFFLLTGIGFTLIVLSALFGRLWCGWACPQTVFLEGVFRRIERLIEGPANTRRALNKAPMTGGKFFKKAAKHAIYLVVAFVVAHIFISYFVSLPALFEMMISRPTENWTSFLWATALTGIFYFNFYWFREQTCLILCPYGRLQSALQDHDTFNIGYDKKRGEPRARVGTEGAGDCIDCKRCIAVCPTSIDIRNGLQLECVGCAACIDACNEIMVKVGKPEGLIRYDSERGLHEGVRRFWRPRVYYYLVAGMVGLTVAAGFFLTHLNFEANVVRPPGLPYALDGETIHNQVSLHLVNKNAGDSTLSLKGNGPEGVQIIIPKSEVALPSLQDMTVPVMITFTRGVYKRGMEIHILVHDSAGGESRDVPIKLMAPGGV